MQKNKNIPPRAISILFEDDQILVIDKPSGMTVNRAETTKFTDTVQDWADTRYGQRPELPTAPEPVIVEVADVSDSPEDGTTPSVSEESGIDEDVPPERYTPEESFRFRSGIVHRLDRETSGVLLIAKTVEAFTFLQKEFFDRKVQKEYQALCVGLPSGMKEKSEFSVDAAIGRSPRYRQKFAVVEQGRSSQTHFVIDRVLVHEYKLFPLLTAHPKTGRTHQIRVHLAAMGMPVAGDALYCGKKTFKAYQNLFPRLMLHAHRLTVTHPTSEENMTFESALPEDFQKVIHLLSSH